MSHPALHRSGEPVLDCSNRHKEESSPEKVLRSSFHLGTFTLDLSHPALHRSGEPVLDCSSKSHKEESSPEKVLRSSFHLGTFTLDFEKVWRKRPAARSQWPRSTIGSAWGTDCMVGIDTRAHKSVHPGRLLSSNSRSERRGKRPGRTAANPSSTIASAWGSVACLSIKAISSEIGGRGGARVELASRRFYSRL